MHGYFFKFKKYGDQTHCILWMCKPYQINKSHNQIFNALAGEFTENICIQVCIVHVFNSKFIHAKINPALSLHHSAVWTNLSQFCICICTCGHVFCQSNTQNSWKKNSRATESPPNSASAQKVFILREIRKKQETIHRAWKYYCKADQAKTACQITVVPFCHTKLEKN